jgi:hypothetical protein
MKLNFYNVYESIKEQLTKEKDLEGLKKLKNKIKENKNFAQSFIIYNNLKNKTANLDIIKEFSVGIQSTQKELKSLLEFFNIKDIREIKINESLDNVVNYKNKSLLTDLSTIKEDEELIKKYLLDDNEEELEENLTFDEESACQIIESKDIKRLNKKSEYIFSLSKKLEEGKEKKMIQESVKKLIQEKVENIKDSTFGIYSIYNRIQQLNESKFGGAQDIKIGDIGLYKNIKLFTEEDYKNPEYMILYVEIPIKLFSDNKNDFEEEKKILSKRYITELRSLLKKFLDPNLFLIGDTITETNMVCIKNNCIFKTQIILNVKPGNKERQLMLYREYIKALMNKISNSIEENIPQLNKKFQES